MSFIPSNIEERIPAEFRESAERLFATQDTGFAASKEPVILAFAQDLGVKDDLLEILHAKDRERAMKRLLGHFRNNVELLIQKTWVEKADEKHKEKLLDRIPVFIHQHGIHGDVLVQFLDHSDLNLRIALGQGSKRDH